MIGIGIIVHGVNDRVLSVFGGCGCRQYDRAQRERQAREYFCEFRMFHDLRNSLVDLLAIRSCVLRPGAKQLRVNGLARHRAFVIQPTQPRTVKSMETENPYRALLVMRNPNAETTQSGAVIVELP